MALLEDEYAYATECNLATISEMRDIKSTSKSRLERQIRITSRMLSVCYHIQEKIDWRPVGGSKSSRYLRVAELLERGRTETEFKLAIERALEGHQL